MGLSEMKDAIEFVLSNEGGISNHKDDPGGLTKYGITRGFAESLGFDFDKIVSRNDAAKIYKVFYKKYFVRFEKIDKRLAIYMFDLAVHVGLQQAIKLLQVALNDCVGAGLVIDGVFGPKTMAALSSAISRNPAEFWRQLDVACVRFYLGLVSRKPNLLVFLRGWLNRQKERVSLHV